MESDDGLNRLRNFLGNLLHYHMTGKQLEDAVRDRESGNAWGNNSLTYPQHTEAIERMITDLLWDDEPLQKIADANLKRSFDASVSDCRRLHAENEQLKQDLCTVRNAISNAEVVAINCKDLSERLLDWAEKTRNDGQKENTEAASD